MPRVGNAHSDEGRCAETRHRVGGGLPLVMFVCPCQNEEKILDPVHTPQADVKASLTIPNHSQSGGVCHESCL